MRFSKDILKAGLYHVGGGLFHEVTKADVHEYAQNFASMRAAGIEVPLPWEHPPLDKGMPELSDDYSKRAEATKYNAGWLESVRVEGDAAIGTLNVPDETDAKIIKSGKVRGVSPRLVNEEWRDGRGRVWKKFVAHVALTNHPRDTRQGRFQAIDHSTLSHSRTQVVDVFMADDEKPFPKAGEGESDEGAEPVAPVVEKPSNPDMPGGGDQKEKQQMEAILAHLKEFGVVLPADTSDETFKRDLLTALMSAGAAKKSAEPAEAAKDDANLQEQSAMQFSNSPLFKEFVKLKRETLVSKIKSSKMTPAARKVLLERAGSIQLSSNGSESASMTLSQVAELLDSTSGGLDGLSQSIADLSVESPSLGTQSMTLADGSTATPAEERAAVARLTANERR